MLNVDIFLAVIAIIIIIGYISKFIFKLTKIPEVVILMLIGISLGHLGNLLPQTYIATLNYVAPLFGTIALITIMFNSSKNIRFGDRASPVGIGLLLAVADVLVVTIVMAVFMKAVFDWPLIYGAILGAILGETTAIVVLPLINNLEINKDVYNMVLTEATVNSAISILIFYLMISFLNGSAFTLSSYSFYIVSSLSIPIVIGAAIGLIWLYITNTVKWANGYLPTIAIALLLYSAVSSLNGSAIISVLVFAIILGNSGVINEYIYKREPQSKEEDNGLEENLEFLIRTFFFVFIGIIAVITVTYLAYALLITAVLIILRYIEVIPIIRNDKKVRGFVSSLVPRGLTVAVLSTILYSSVGGTYPTQIFEISFMVIIFTNIIASALISNSVRKMEKSQEEPVKSAENARYA